MDNGKADIIAGIRELRAKAVEQLTGNEYYMIVQQLDSLATSAELSDEAARSVFTLISARLAGSAPAVSAAGGPEVPETPSTPAQPDTPSTPEQPVIPDSPAQPDSSPGPEIPSPPSSPAEPQTPPETSSAPAVAAGSEEPVQIVTPSANSFGMPQATVALRFAEPVTPAEDAPAAKPVGGLADAVMATRTLIEERLSGNSYYSAANLLGQLQILPPTSGGGDMTRPDGFDGALTLLRREAAHLTGIAHDEAARIIATLENVLMPKPQPVAEMPAEAAAPQPAAPEAEPAAPEAEAAASQSAVPEVETAAPEAAPEPRTGFDDLADAAWKRVQQVSADDPRPAAALNGSAAPAPLVEEAAPVPVVEPAPAIEPTPVAAVHDGSTAPAPVVEEVPPAVEPTPLTAAHDGSNAPTPVAEEAEPAVEPAPVAAAQTEMMAQDIGEAFNDGGSESRSSEPCYLHEFELAGAQHGASDRQEPAAEAGVDAASETQSQAAVSAEAETLTAPAEAADAEPLADVEEANVLTVAAEEVAEPQASGQEETVPLEEPVAAEAELRVSELEQAAAVPEQAMPLEELAVATAETAVSTAEPTVEVEPVVEKVEPVVAAAEPVAAETEAAVAASPVIETEAEPAVIAAAATKTEDKAPAAEPAPAAQAASAAKPAKRGFFGRLFGGSSAENRR